MADNKTLIARVYAGFNRRDIDGVLTWMSESVSWPRVVEGGRAVGKEEIRSYWTRQWKEVDPHVEPIEVNDDARGRTEVRVHQVVKNLQGEVLLDKEVRHIYTISNGLIDRMDVEEDDADADASPSAASSKP